jgi:hypothetical protein
MTELDEQIDARLRRLAAATDQVRPLPGFEERVMASIATTPEPEWWAGVVRIGRIGLFAATLAAAAAAILALRSERVTDQAYAVAYGTVEQEW